MSSSFSVCGTSNPAVRKITDGVNWRKFINDAKDNKLHSISRRLQVPICRHSLNTPDNVSVHLGPPLKGGEERVNASLTDAAASYANKTGVARETRK